MKYRSQLELKRQLNFDLYGRYATAREIINLNRIKSRMRVIDIGGRGNLLREFLPNDEVYYLDPYVNSDDDNYIEGDGCDIPAADNSFDWVMSADVLEHIPLTKRNQFIKEKIRVASQGIILIAPFQDEKVRESEITINHVYKAVNDGKDHPWLKEHIDNILPDSFELEEFLRSSKLDFNVRYNNYLPLWNQILFAQNIIDINESKELKIALENFNEYYNENIYYKDNNKLSYRKIYTIKKEHNVKYLESKFYEINGHDILNLGQRLNEVVIQGIKEKKEKIFVNNIDLPENILRFSKIYLDYGNDFSENKIQTYQNQDDLNEIIVYIPNFPGIKRFRFDPIEDFCIMQVLNVSMYFSETQKEMRINKLVTNNSFLEQNDLFFFDAIDPHFIFDLTTIRENIDFNIEDFYNSEIKIRYRIVAHGIEAINRIIILKNEMLTKLNSSNNQLQKRNSYLEGIYQKYEDNNRENQRIRYKADLSEQLINDIEILKNTISWRVTKPIRYLRNILSIIKKVFIIEIYSKFINIKYLIKKKVINYKKHKKHKEQLQATKNITNDAFLMNSIESRIGTSTSRSINKNTINDYSKLNSNNVYLRNEYISDLIKKYKIWYATEYELTLYSKIEKRINSKFVIYEVGKFLFILQINKNNVHDINITLERFQVISKKYQNIRFNICFLIDLKNLKESEVSSLEKKINKKIKRFFPGDAFNIYVIKFNFWENKSNNLFLETISRIDYNTLFLIKPGYFINEYSLYCIIKALQKNKDKSIIFFDEDIVDKNEAHLLPRFKTSFDIYKFIQCDYITNFFVLRKQIIINYLPQLQQLFTDFSFDSWKLLTYLGVINAHLKNKENIVESNLFLHIPIIACHKLKKSKQNIMDYLWHRHADLFEFDDIYYNKSIADILKERNKFLYSLMPEIELCNKDRYNSTGFGINFLSLSKPKISIIIPTKDRVDLLKQCIDSILIDGQYENLEIIIIDNNSKEIQSKQYFSEIKKEYPSLIYLIHDATTPFNYAKINNSASKEATGEYLLFLNNDIVASGNTWLKIMASILNKDDIGIVGAKLYYPDSCIQHAGIVIGMGGVAGNYQSRAQDFELDTIMIDNFIQEKSAVSAACLLIKKDLFHKVNGFDEVNLKVDFNDVDLCLKVKELGYKVIWSPDVKLFHYESISRETDLNFFEKERFEYEVRFMMKKWKLHQYKDGYFNANLSLCNNRVNLCL